MDLKRRIPALALGSMVLATTAFAGVTTVAAQDATMYRFTIVNLAPGQPLTPPVVAIHDSKTSIVQAGAAASEGIQQLSENGNNAPLVEALQADRNVGAVAQGESPILSGGAPGAAEFPSVAVIEVSSDKKTARLFSLAAMMICTNDGFAVLADQKLPKKIGQSVVFHAKAYDAGTEINTEVLGDMVPPCQGLVGVTSDADGVGASDPSLAENGVVSPHAGIVGEADLDPAVHAVADAPALVVVERIS